MTSHPVSCKSLTLHLVVAKVKILLVPDVCVDAHTDKSQVNVMCCGPFDRCKCFLLVFPQVEH